MQTVNTRRVMANEQDSLVVDILLRDSRDRLRMQGWNCTPESPTLAGPCSTTFFLVPKNAGSFPFSLRCVFAPINSFRRLDSSFGDLKLTAPTDRLLPDQDL